MLLSSAAEAFVALTRNTWDSHSCTHPLALEPHLGQVLLLVWGFFCLLWAALCSALSAPESCLLMPLQVALGPASHFACHCWTCWCHWAGSAWALPVLVRMLPRCPFRLPPRHPLQSCSARAVPGWAAPSPCAQGVLFVFMGLTASDCFAAYGLFFL